MFKKIGIAVTTLFVINQIAKAGIVTFSESVRYNDPNIDDALTSIESASDDINQARKWKRFYFAELLQAFVEYNRETRRSLNQL